MKSITLSMDFFLGGKAIFTVQNTQSGEHRTYKIRKSRPNPAYPNPAWFISQMTGTDNESHYSNVGKINTTTGAITLTRISQFAEGSSQLAVARWICRKIFLNKTIGDNTEVRHAGKCGRCGRTLTTPESLDRGIGPECWHIMGHAR